MNRLPPSNIRKITGLAFVAAALAACQPKPQPIISVSHAALPTMERIALGANACWFKSGGDPAFRAYRMALELNSLSGRPRILLVPHNSPESRPMLVVQAEGSPAKIDAFGPVMNEAIATRIAADIKRWANGGKGCWSGSGRLSLWEARKTAAPVEIGAAGLPEDSVTSGKETIPLSSKKASFY